MEVPPWRPRNIPKFLNLLYQRERMSSHMTLRPACAQPALLPTALTTGCYARCRSARRYRGRLVQTPLCGQGRRGGICAKFSDEVGHRGELRERGEFEIGLDSQIRVEREAVASSSLSAAAL